MQLSFKERVIHSVLFEIGGVTLASLAVIIVGNAETANAVAVGVTMATVGMVWNFVFNLLFDKVIKDNRAERGIGLRIVHTLLFKLGMLIIATPIVMYLMNWTLIQALLADVGLTVLIAVYAFMFNWSFDVLLAKLQADAV